METFVYQDKKKLRCGYTTGSCAALAAKAAVRCLAGGGCVKEERILTPGGETVQAEVRQWETGTDEAGTVIWAQCGVQKDGGDDCDVTDGLLIFVRAGFGEGEDGNVSITGGPGIGRVTKEGLDQPVGAYAINSVPRRMMEEEALSILKEAGLRRSLCLTVWAPDGEAAAKKTFNPVLGIEGGISILGTTGIVRPMSNEALTETIRVHLRVLHFEHRKFAAVSPGNLGSDWLMQYAEEAGLGEREKTRFRESIVASSNFIGKTVDMAGELGFSGLLLAGHIGKLVKLGNGIMDTHSREGDGRMDTLLSCALECGGERPLLLEIRKSNTTNQAVDVLNHAGMLEPVMKRLLVRMKEYLSRRAMDSLQVEVLLFGSRGELLGKTEGADQLLRKIRKECGRNEGQDTD